MSENVIQVLLLEDDLTEARHLNALLVEATPLVWYPVAGRLFAWEKRGCRQR